MALDLVELQTRWTRAWTAKSEENTKHSLINVAKYQYEKHLREGLVWGDSFRFPELLGIGERKYDNLVEVMPDVKIKGDNDDAIALQASIDHQKRISNLERERNRALRDAVDYGTGCIMVCPIRFEAKDGTLMYDGLGAERIDYRDIFPAHSALVLHDHTGIQRCPFLFRRRIYYKSSFLEKYDKEPFNREMVKKVTPIAWGAGFSGTRMPTAKESREKTFSDYITVLEYWDVENDELRIFANNWDAEIFSSPKGIPYSHKQLPFHFYYDYRRDDSIAGIGEIELNMPYNIFREMIFNLMIDDAKLSLQPAYIIDGDVAFNTEENELEPGAVFTVRGLKGGKVSDSVMPFRTGGIPAEAFNLVTTLENSQIAVTGDDVRSLFVNPQQLATQTLSKREAMQKRIRGNVVRNTIESEWYLHNQLISYMQNELAKPYKNAEGKKTHRKIKVSGYDAIQDKPTSDVSFKIRYGAESEFYLNAEIAEYFHEKEIEVIPTKLDAEIKRDKMEKLVSFMGQVMTTAQVAPQLLQGLDIPELLKETAKNLEIDIKKIFPAVEKKEEQIDEINAEHEQIAMGIVPEIKPDEDSMQHYMEHTKFEQSDVFKKFGKKAKDAMKKHKLLTIKNIYVQKTIQSAGAAGGMEQPLQTRQQVGVSGVSGLSPSAPAGGQGQAVLPATSNGMAAGPSGGAVPAYR